MGKNQEEQAKLKAQAEAKAKRLAEKKSNRDKRVAHFREALKENENAFWRGGVDFSVAKDLGLVKTNQEFCEQKIKAFTKYWTDRMTESGNKDTERLKKREAELLKKLEECRLKMKS